MTHLTELGTPGFALHPLRGIHEPTRSTPARQPNSVRRTTSIDITRTPGAPDPVYLLGLGRDLVTAGDGTVRVTRTAGLSATVDRDTRWILESRATPRVLPWQECPGAAQSAARITGMTLPELHSRVRRELHGTDTCTHLNDLLRSIADAQPLLDLLPVG